MKYYNAVRRFGAKVVGTASALALIPSVALAQTVTLDPTDTLALVDEAVAFISAVGLAVLGLIMLAKGIKWVRRAG